MKKTKTTVIVNLQVTMIIPGDATSEEDKQHVINDIYKKLNADDINVKDIKIFLIEGRG